MNIWVFYGKQWADSSLYVLSLAPSIHVLEAVFRGLTIGRSLSQGGSHLALGHIVDGVIEDERGGERVALPTVVSTVSEWNEAPGDLQELQVWAPLKNDHQARLLLPLRPASSLQAYLFSGLPCGFKPRQAPLSFLDLLYEPHDVEGLERLGLEYHLWELRWWSSG